MSSLAKGQLSCPFPPSISPHLGLYLSGGDVQLSSAGVNNQQGCNLQSSKSFVFFKSLTKKNKFWSVKQTDMELLITEM